MIPQRVGLRVRWSCPSRQLHRSSAPPCNRQWSRHALSATVNIDIKANRQKGQWAVVVETSPSRHCAAPRGVMCADMYIGHGRFLYSTSGRSDGKDRSHANATATTSAKGGDTSDGAPPSDEAKPSLRNLLSELGPDFRYRYTLLTGAQFLVNAGFGVVIPVLPQLSNEFGLGAAGLGMIISAPAITRVLFNIPMGVLADKKGRIPLMVTGMLLSALAQVITAFATNIPTLMLARLLVGIGSGASLAGSQAYMADMTDAYPEHRSKLMGVQAMMVNAAFVVGPAFGGLVADAYGYKPSFLLVAAACAITTLGYTKLPESLSRPKEGDVARAPALSSMQMLRFPSLQGSILIQLALHLGYSAIISVVPLHATAMFNATPGNIGALLSVISGLGFVGAPLGGWLADSIGKKRAIVPSAFLVAGSAIGLSFAWDFSSFMVCMLGWGLGNSLVTPGLTAYTADASPSESRGAFLALVRQAADFAFLVGPISLGVICDMEGSPAALAATGVVVGVSTATFAAISPINPLYAPAQISDGGSGSGSGSGSDSGSGSGSGSGSSSGSDSDIGSVEADVSPNKTVANESK